jgi:hypothetical protein
MIEFNPQKAMLSDDAPWWKKALSHVGDVLTSALYKLEAITRPK